MAGGRIAISVGCVLAGLVCAPAWSQVGGCTAATHVSTAGEGAFTSHVAADDGLIVTWRPHARRLRVIDAQDPQFPEPLGFAYINGTPIGLAFDSGYAVATTRLEGHATGELWVFDVRNPAAPFLEWRGGGPYDEGVISATLRGRQMFATSQDELFVYDILEHEILFRGRAPVSYGSDIEVVGDLAYVLSAPLGDPALVIVDVSDPSDPVTLSRSSLPGLFPLRLAVANQTAYVVIDFNQVWSVDVSDPLNPAVLATVVSPESIVDVAARYNALYVMENDPGAVHIYDMVDPAAPRWIDAHTPPNQPSDVDVTAGLVVVADGADGVHLLQLSDCSSCRVDLAEPTGVLDYFDVRAFLGLFAEGHRAADLDVNAVWDVRDVLAWLEEFAAGCP